MFLLYYNLYIYVYSELVYHYCVSNILQHIKTVNKIWWYKQHFFKLCFRAKYNLKPKMYIAVTGLSSYSSFFSLFTFQSLATDSCTDGWNVRNCSSSHVQVFRDRWNVQIGDGWNVRNCLNMNFLKLVKIWIWILQNLRCLSCKSTNFVLVVKPTLMSLFWLFGLCLFGLLFAMYDW